MLEAIGEVTGNTFDIQVVPRPRAVSYIENNQVDFQVPNTIFFQDPEKIAKLQYDFSSIKLMYICFVLYSNKNKNIDIEELKAGNPKNYKIDTDISMLNSFTFKLLPSTDTEGSLKKIEAERIDGYIWSQSATDPVLKKMGLKNIKRQLYGQYTMTFALRKGAKGGEVEQMLKNGIDKLKANGKYDGIIGNYFKTNSIYNNWQP